MNWDQVAGQWKLWRGRIKKHWGKLTDSDLQMIEGRRDELVGVLQERYGYPRLAAERDVDDFILSFTRKEQQRKAA